jgi:hypothetical protein
MRSSETSFLFLSLTTTDQPLAGLAHSLDFTLFDLIDLSILHSILLQPTGLVSTHHLSLERVSL